MVWWQQHSLRQGVAGFSAVRQFNDDDDDENWILRNFGRRQGSFSSWWDNIASVVNQWEYVAVYTNIMDDFIGWMTQVCRRSERESIWFSFSFFVSLCMKRADFMVPLHWNEQFDQSFNIGAPCQRSFHLHWPAMKIHVELFMPLVFCIDIRSSIYELCVGDGVDIPLSLPHQKPMQFQFKRHKHQIWWKCLGKQMHIAFCLSLWGIDAANISWRSWKLKWSKYSAQRSIDCAVPVLLHTGVCRYMKFQLLAC